MVTPSLTYSLSLSANLFPIKIPIFKLNSSPLDSTPLWEKMVNQPEHPPLFPSPLLCSITPLPFPLAPSVLCPRAASSVASAPPSLSTDFRGKQLLSLYSLRPFLCSFVRPFVLSFILSSVLSKFFPPLSFNCDRWRPTDRPRAGPTFPVLLFLLFP